MKKFAFLALFAYVVLSGAALWMGALNQDEGWYLYAARLVREGQMPYRDFFFTQAPLLPTVYSVFTGVFKGVLGGRILTALFGLLGLLCAIRLVRELVPPEKRGISSLIVAFLLGSNLYHIYYTSIPKTYALGGLFVMIGYLFLALGLKRQGIKKNGLLFLTGIALAFAAGTRISLGALLPVVGLGLLFSYRKMGLGFVWFGIGGFLGLGLVYAPYLLDPTAREGLFAAQAYHAARGGFDPVFTIGSLSRLVRWYAPVFVLAGGAILFYCERHPVLLREAPRPTVSGTPSYWERHPVLLGEAPTPAHLYCLAGFLAVFLVQIAAPFPYEDYQVPIMPLFVVFIATYIGWRATDASHVKLWLLLALGLTWAGSFGSPLLQEWMTNGQDRFWTLKKAKTELAQLRDAAAEVEKLDPNGKDILTQDLYLAVEAGRKVPHGLEMGPFSMLTDDEWRALLDSAPCKVAALSGYSFAIMPPICNERPWEQQAEFCRILREKYDFVEEMQDFGQNATTLLLLKRKEAK